jgi:hypothetical protein
MAEKRQDSNENPATETAMSLLPEVLAAVKQDQVGQININILLQQVTQRAGSSEEALERTESLLKMAQRYEDHRLKAFQARADAIINVKQRDPDEIEKRLNNRVRRWLKCFLAIAAVVGLGGAAVAAAYGANIVLTGMLGSAGALSVAMLGPLATGESVSSTDVVRIVQALRGGEAADEQGGRKKRR